MEVSPESDHPTIGASTSNFLLQPVARLVLISALGFGCCVSSFVYRRQKEDRFQAIVFVVLIAAVAAVGYAVEASPNMILLGYMPFATCAAMILSISGHSALRWLRSGDEFVPDDDEKLQLLDQPGSVRHLLEKDAEIEPGDHR